MTDQNQNQNNTEDKELKKTFTVPEYDRTKFHAYMVKSDWSTSRNGDEFPVIDIPTASTTDITKKLEEANNVNIGNTKDHAKWVDTLENSIDNLQLKDALDDAVNDPDSTWINSVEYNGKHLEPTQPKMADIQNTKLTGEKAVHRVLTSLGLGAVFQVPLWHSGFWITLKPPTESEIVELFRLLTASKIELGRATHGLIYTDTSVHTYQYVMDFIEDHIYNTTVKKPGDIRKLIRIQDLQPLIWGMVCAMYPSGVPYRRACINNPESCNYVVEEKINPRRLLWVDYDSLDPSHINHMSHRQPNSMTQDEVHKYQKSLSSISTYRKKLNYTKTDADVYITYKSPFIRDYIDMGNKYISDLIELVNSTKIDLNDEDSINNAINNHARASLMRQYSHMVDSIEIDTNIIEDPDTINDVLSALSADPKLTDTFINDVLEYINRSTISVIGIPSFKCPVCNSEQVIEDTPDAFTNIIPMDVLSTFFTLTLQELEKTLSQ